MNKKHKHSELIKAWADGATIECNDCGVWFYANNPTWQENMEYRIKPEQKPDLGILFSVGRVHHQTTQKQISCNPYQKSNLKLIFDGETGVLKSAEVLK